MCCPRLRLRTGWLFAPLSFGYPCRIPAPLSPDSCTVPYRTPAPLLCADLHQPWLLKVVRALSLRLGNNLHSTPISISISRYHTYIRMPTPYPHILTAFITSFLYHLYRQQHLPHVLIIASFLLLNFTFTRHLARLPSFPKYDSACRMPYSILCYLGPAGRITAQTPSKSSSRWCHGRLLRVYQT
jgi:hypothetical protein